MSWLWHGFCVKIGWVLGDIFIYVAIFVLVVAVAIMLQYKTRRSNDDRRKPKD